MKLSLISAIILSLPVGLVAAFPGGAVLYFLYMTFYVAPRMRDRIKRAETVEAKLDYSKIRSSTDPKDVVRSTYYYEVDGVRYRYVHGSTRHSVAELLTLYYLPGDPAHATTRQFFTGNRRGTFWICYLIALPVCMLLFALFCMKSVQGAIS